MDVYNQSRISKVYGGTIPLIVLATTLVVTRLIARRVSVAKLWWDDYTIIAALVSIIRASLMAPLVPSIMFYFVRLISSSLSPEPISDPHY